MDLNYNQINLNNKAIFFDIINQLKNVVNDLNHNKKIDNIIKQIKNIIEILNKNFNENR